MIRFNSNIAQGMRIYVEDTQVTYHTINTWGLAIVNTDCIKEPEQETAYVNIPFTDGFIDMSEVVAGRPTYLKRSIEVKLKGFRNIRDWDAEISDIRNKINGRVCRLSFDNDREYFWRGRVVVEDFERERECGYFNINIPQADPYKYNWQSMGEPWIWDTFNFVSGRIYTSGEITVNGTATITAPAGKMYTMPKFKCSNIGEGQTLTVTDGTTTLNLKNGSNSDPRIEVNGKEAVTLTFTGNGKVTVTYRGGSL